MTTGQDQVKDFMRFFGQETPDRPTQLTEEAAKLRAGLILEEALETITKGLGLCICIDMPGQTQIRVAEATLKQASLSFLKVKEVDLVELSDGLGDSAYVGEFGTAVAAGIDLEPIQDIIHAANMTKAWTENQLEEAIRLYPTAKIENYGGGLYRLIREDGKVIKSPNFREPNAAIKEEIERQQNAPSYSFEHAAAQSVEFHKLTQRATWELDDLMKGEQ